MRVDFKDGRPPVEGGDATECLTQLLGGWNPDTFIGLRLAFEHRHAQLTGAPPEVDVMELSDPRLLRWMESLGWVNVIDPGQGRGL